MNSKYYSIYLCLWYIFVLPYGYYLFIFSLLDLARQAAHFFLLLYYSNYTIYKKKKKKSCCCVACCFFFAGWFACCTYTTILLYFIQRNPLKPSASCVVIQCTVYKPYSSLGWGLAGLAGLAHLLFLLYYQV